MTFSKKSSAQNVLAILVTCQVILAFAPTSNAANILFHVGVVGDSHRLAMQPLANALAEKGHNVTFILQDNPKSNKNIHPAIQYYIPEKASEHYKSAGGPPPFYKLRASGRGFLMQIFVQSFGIQLCDKMYSDPGFLEWLQNSPKFDLVIMDALFNECGYGIAHLHGAKTILFCVSTVVPWAIERYGLPDESAWIPDLMSSIPIEMSFKHRVVGAVMPVIWSTFRSWYYLPAVERILREGLKEQVEKFPSLAELERNTSVVFVNTHASQEFARALPPNVIPVGGISWIDQRKPLPKKLEDFINEGSEGFIYISFGSSTVDFLTFPEDVQETFINALKRFPNIQFIWKLNKVPENLPKNILIEKWLPQQDLLLHPKIRAFVTHSGIGGIMEAIYSSVPLICFPLFSEQDYNAQLAQKRGFGIKMEITTLTEEVMADAIRNITTDNSYKENVKMVTKQFLDRPMKPLESALWWTEYVLREESTEHLRSQNIQLSWWTKRQLDVWLLVLLVTILFNSIGLYISYKVFKRCLKSRRTIKKEKLT